MKTFFVSNFPDFRKGIALFALAQISAAFTSGKSSKKNKINLKH
jgi:hypothetical protein